MRAVGQGVDVRREIKLSNVKESPPGYMRKRGCSWRQNSHCSILSLPKLALLNSQLAVMTKDDPDYERIEKQFFEIARRLRGNPET